MYRLRVKEIVQSKGYNQSKLMRKADVAYKTVQTLWRNPAADVQLTTLDKIALALEVRLTELIDDQY